MKRSIAILLALGLLAGCADSTASQQEQTSQTISAPETTEPTSQSTAAENTPVVSTPDEQAGVTASSDDTGISLDLPEPADVIYPSICNDADSWQINYAVDGEDIIAQLGYDTSVDITQLAEYKWAFEFAQSVDDKEREELISTNYSDIDFYWSFVGSEKADWLYTASYRLIVGGPNYYGYYTKVFYVKDGRITEILAEFESGSFDGIRQRGSEYIFPIDNEGIYSLNVETNELTKLCDCENLCRIIEMSEDYIFFRDSDDCIKVYYFDSGEVFPTVVYRGVQDGYFYLFSGDIIFFSGYPRQLTEQYPDASNFKLDLITKVYSPLYEVDWRGLESLYSNAEEERYTVEADGRSLTVTDNTDNSVKKYSLLSLRLELGIDDELCDVRNFFVCDNVVYGFIRQNDYYIFALDMETELFYTTDTGLDRVYDSQLSENGSIMVSYRGSTAEYMLSR